MDFFMSFNNKTSTNAHAPIANDNVNSRQENNLETTRSLLRGNTVTTNYACLTNCFPPICTAGGLYSSALSSDQTAASLTLLPLGTEVFILPLSLTTTTGQILKLDSMAEVELTTDNIASYQYTITYILYLDATPLSTVTIEKDVDNASAAVRLLGELPNITWIDTPTAGAHIYRIGITVTGTNITNASVETRAFNAIIFG